MKLYEIPKNSKLKVTLNSGREVEAMFHHLDGAYSYCTLHDGDPDNVFHLSVNTELKLEDGYYLILDDK